ncbi:FHA domain-containing protein [Streptomyces sp. NPDC057620]|uniref:FHA domain-containing protein n=1 Tax=Streptomyces sp. NPDC057620 TaxID=3346185 RepID=UPI003674657B
MESPMNKGPLGSGESAAGPRLVITDPARFRNTTLVLTGGRQIIGRAPGCDLRLEHPHLSGHHAQLRMSGAQVLIENLCSNRGTHVNGRPTHEPHRLHSGDIVCFGDVRARFDDPARHATQTREPAFYIKSQQARNINNVGRDQHVHEVQQSFLKEVAAARSRGRSLILVGFMLSIGGFSVYGWGVVRLVGSVVRIFQKPLDPAASSIDDFDREWHAQISEVPILLFGGVAASIGGTLMVVGLVLHVVATARRRAYERITFHSPDREQP